MSKVSYHINAENATEESEKNASSDPKPDLSEEFKRATLNRQTLTARRKTMMLEKLLAEQRNRDKLVIIPTTFDAKHRNYKSRDDKDVPSRDPSYTFFEIPFAVQCRMRYTRSREIMEKQFQKELKKLEIFQPSAYEAARYNRHFAYTTLWPPLHNVTEIDRLGKFFERTPAEKKRLWFLLHNDQY